MSTPEHNSETARQRDIRLLRHISSNQPCSFHLNGNPFAPAEDLLALDSLLKEGFIDGYPMENTSGFPVSFTQIKMFGKGRDRLEELTRQESGQAEWPKQVETLKHEIEKLQNQIKELKDQPVVEHTLLNYWKLGRWEERFGMVGSLVGIFVCGYLCAKVNAISSLIDLIRSIMP